MLRFARLEMFSRLRRPYQAFMRRRRARMFAQRMQLTPGLRVIDLGGTPEIWRFVDVPLDIVLVNLSSDTGTLAEGARVNGDAWGHHRIRFEAGDACATKYPSGSFDIAFSNSVIEHVGDEERQQMLAKEARRLAPRYWVQTPAKWFPIEAHTGMPLWWFYPEAMRNWLIRKWRKSLPAWTEMVEGTTVLERSAMQRFFPDGKIVTEKSFGIAKSYIACR